MPINIQTMTPEQTALFRAAMDKAGVVDPVAQSNVIKRQTIAKLNDAVNRATLANAYDRPELGAIAAATGMTGTQAGVTFPTTAPTGQKYYAAAVSGAANVDAFCNFYGTPVVYGGSLDHVMQRTGTTSAATTAAGANVSSGAGNTLTNGRATLYALEFLTDCPSPTLKFVAGGGSPYFKIIVDGQYVTKALGALTTIPANRFTTLSFGSRKLRRIRLEAEQDFAFDGIFVDTLSQVSKVPTGQIIRAAMIGDSYLTTSTAGLPMWDGPLQVMSKLLGWDDVRNSGIPGTGFLNAGAAWTFGSHIADFNVGADVGLIGGAFNDNGLNMTSLQSTALGVYQTARAANPNMPLICLGSWSGGTGPSAAVIATESALAAAFAQFADNFSIFVPISGQPTVSGIATPQSWVFGTGNDGNLLANGNSDLYTKGDGIHPNALGFDYIGRRLARAVGAGLAVL